MSDSHSHGHAAPHATHAHKPADPDAKAETKEAKDAGAAAEADKPKDLAAGTAVKVGDKTGKVVRCTGHDPAYSAGGAQATYAIAFEDGTHTHLLESQFEVVEKAKKGK